MPWPQSAFGIVAIEPILASRVASLPRSSFCTYATLPSIPIWGDISPKEGACPNLSSLSGDWLACFLPCHQAAFEVVDFVAGLRKASGSIAAAVACLAIDGHRMKTVYFFSGYAEKTLIKNIDIDGTEQMPIVVFRLRAHIHKGDGIAIGEQQVFEIVRTEVCIRFLARGAQETWNQNEEGGFQQ